MKLKQANHYLVPLPIQEDGENLKNEEKQGN